MLNVKPHTAILLATYNGEKFLERQLDSLFAQTDRDWVIYAHDDGSSDGTVDILRKYQSEYPDEIVILDGAPTGSARDNFFYLMENAEADCYFFCDQDDIWEQDKIEIFRRKMYEAEAEHGGGNKAEDETPCLVFSDVSLIDESDNLIVDRMSTYQTLDMARMSFNELMLQNIVTGCAMMANRALVEKALQCVERRDIIMHDYWLALVAAYFGRISYIDAAMVKYRQHEANALGATRVLSAAYFKEKFQSARRSLIERQNQMKAFVEAYNLTYADAPEAVIMSRLFELPKGQRINFYKSCGGGKSGFLRKLGLYLFG